MDISGDMNLRAIHVIKKMIEFKSALIKERVEDGMAKAKGKGRTMGRPSTDSKSVELIEELAVNTDYSIRKIKMVIGNSISYSVVQQSVQFF